MVKYSPWSWLKSLAFALVILGLAGFIGQLFAHSTLIVGLSALGLLGWHDWQRQKIISQLIYRQYLPPHSLQGSWNTLRHLLHRNQHTHRARQRRLLQRLRAYHTVASALPDAVMIVERSTQRLQWFNPAARHLLGLQAPADYGAALVSRLQPLPLATWLAHGRHAQPLLDVVSPVNPAIRLHLKLISLSSEQWLLIARDVSHMLHLEQMRRDFVANVSHELRTPLTVLHGYLELLEPDDMSNTVDISTLLVEMRKQSERMGQLVDDLLTLSRLESAPLVEAPEPVLMSALLHSLQCETQASGCHTVVVKDQSEVDLFGCEKELHSAFSNLLSNAVRHTPDGGRICVVFSGDIKRGAVFSVSDTGPGIAAEHLPRLTERFYRVSRSRSRQNGGTGLGLAIVKHVLERHHARLEIHSIVGQGSTFTCYFPADHVVLRRQK